MLDSSVAKGEVKQEGHKIPIDKIDKASPCVFEDLGRRVGLVKNIEDWPGHRLGDHYLGLKQ
jgi:hypothetical protein